MEESRERLILRSGQSDRFGSLRLQFGTGPRLPGPGNRRGSSFGNRRIQEAVVDIPLDQLTLSLNNTYGAYR